MTDHEIVQALTEPQVVALTLYGEARSEPIEGRFAVASVIRNRLKAQRPSFGLVAREVCLKAWAFSCWLPQGGADNYAEVMAAARSLVAPDGVRPPLLNECLWIADGLLGFQFGDSVRGATHYLTAQLLAAAPPPWAIGKTPVCRINHHVFFAGIR